MAGKPKTRAALGLAPKPGARGYTITHPPFEPGNDAAVRSGAWSPRLIAETVEKLRPALQAIIETAHWIETLDEWALEDYLWDRARLVRLESWLAEHGDRYREGHKRAGELRDRDLREVASLRRRCMDHRSRLGLDPVSRVRMNLDRAQTVDLAALWALENDASGSDFKNDHGENNGVERDPSHDASDAES